ncbi:hypothetical protein MMYC01_210560, partial [Madurella mycetomatis]
MQLISLLTAALLPVGLLAAPVAEDSVADPAGVSPNEDAAGLFKREPLICGIVGGSSRVNCRAGASTSTRIVRTVEKGDWYLFDCVRSGECVTINGATN